MIVGQLRKVSLFVLVAVVLAHSVSLNTMFVTRKALKEPPSLEVILARIGDIYKAQEFTQKILFEMEKLSNVVYEAYPVPFLSCRF